MACAPLFGAAAASAQISGIVWHEIGEPGNEPWDDDRYPNVKFRGRGAVGYTYSMSETELTVEHWLEFVEAYGPHAANPFDRDMLGQGLQGTYEDGELLYWIEPKHQGLPANMSWRFAARFCNWMHNGQVNEAWAFESGAYDTSTFDDDGPPFTDQATRSPGAQYWIPSMDEWMKAAYFDPDRYGPAEPGWWEQPNSSDAPLRNGRPEDGGQTNAALLPVYGWGPDLRAGLYPNEQSPWGLLDLSGGWRELTEEWHYGEWRYSRGSSFGDDMLWWDLDQIQADVWGAGPGSSVLVGLRVASTVPSPGGLGSALGLACLTLSVRSSRS
jgi:hypothetical protein